MTSDAEEEEAGPAAMTLVRVAGRTVPAKTAPGCRVCQSPHRAQIESWILGGYSRPRILEWLADMPAGELEHPSDKSLRLHTDKHLTLGASAQAAIIARRAEALGEDAEKYGGRLADHITALDMVVLKGFDALQDGEIAVDAPTLMKAIDLKHKIDSSVEGGLDANVWRDALMEYMRIAVEFVPPERRAEFARALTTSPVLTALSAKQTP